MYVCKVSAVPTEARRGRQTHWVTDDCESPCGVWARSRMVSPAPPEPTHFKSCESCCSDTSTTFLPNFLSSLITVKHLLGSEGSFPRAGSPKRHVQALSQMINKGQALTEYFKLCSIVSCREHFLWCCPKPLLEIQIDVWDRRTELCRVHRQRELAQTPCMSVRVSLIDRSCSHVPG